MQNKINIIFSEKSLYFQKSITDNKFMIWQSLQHTNYRSDGLVLSRLPNRAGSSGHFVKGLRLWQSKRQDVTNVSIKTAPSLTAFGRQSATVSFQPGTFNPSLNLSNLLKNTRTQRLICKPRRLKYTAKNNIPGGDWSGFLPKSSDHNCRGFLLKELRK